MAQARLAAVLRVIWKKWPNKRIVKNCMLREQNKNKTLKNCFDVLGMVDSNANIL